METTLVERADDRAKYVEVEWYVDDVPVVVGGNVHGSRVTSIYAEDDAGQPVRLPSGLLDEIRADLVRTAAKET